MFEHVNRCVWPVARAEPSRVTLLRTAFRARSTRPGRVADDYLPFAAMGGRAKDCSYILHVHTDGRVSGPLRVPRSSGSRAT